MAVFRLQHNVPEVYVNESRDFQLLCRAYDCINDAVKFDIDTIADVTDTNICNSRLLPLLQTKLGFFSDEQLDNDALRYVLKAFPFMIRNKGSKKGIEQAIYTFLKIHSIDTDVLVSITNADDIDPYSIKIGINSSFKDTTILQEMLKYIIPTGYVVEVFFYTPTSAKMIFTPEMTGRIKYVSSNIISQVRSQDKGNADYIYAYTTWNKNNDTVTNTAKVFGQWVETEEGNYESTPDTNMMSMRTLGAIDTADVVSAEDLFFTNEFDEVEYAVQEDIDFNTRKETIVEETSNE